MTSNWFARFMAKNVDPVPQEVLEENEEEINRFARRSRLGIEDHEEDCKCRLCFPPDHDDRGD